MKPQIQFTPEERLALERILAIQSEKAKHTITLSYLLDDWSQFVISVEDEYRLTIDDYTNSLSGRNLIQELLDACPENTGLKEWINEWDNRFIKATRVVKEPLLYPLPGKVASWWWFRIPNHPGSKLKKWFQITKQE